MVRRLDWEGVTNLSKDVLYVCTYYRARDKYVHTRPLLCCTRGPQVRNDEWEHVKTMKALQKDVSLERER